MNVQNRTIFSNDNLPILRGLDTDTIDLIYLDPPFNSNRNYAAPIGSEAAGAAFKDTWTLSDVDNAWHGEIAERAPALYQAIHAAELTHGKGMKSYLIMMAVRLLEMKRVLKNTGSIYLHCAPTASHYLKLLMDSVFGKENFRNEIVWNYEKWTNAARYFQRNHDIVLMYSVNDKYTFNKQYGELTERQRQLIRTGYNTGSSSGKKIVRIYNRKNPNVQTKLPIWTEEGRAIYDVSLPKGKALNDVWKIAALNGQAKERLGYPTQKPIQLLERIIKASSNQGGVVLDPFCGCATTCVAAERLQRHWIGIDISPKAVDLVRVRLEKEIGILGNVIHRTDIPKRSEKLPNYRTHKHTLFGKQEGLCNGCSTQFPFRNMTVDHIVPKSQGGTDHEDNLQLLCGACNSTKGQGTQAELIARLKIQGILR